MMNLKGLSASKGASASKSKVTFFFLTSLYFLVTGVISHNFVVKSNIFRNIGLCYWEGENRKFLKVRNL